MQSCCARIGWHEESAEVIGEHFDMAFEMADENIRPIKPSIVENVLESNQSQSSRIDHLVINSDINHRYVIPSCAPLYDTDQT